ncbi:MAG: DUF4270 family protein, partial [Bacteroidales bacterium]
MINKINLSLLERCFDPKYHKFFFKIFSFFSVIFKSYGLRSLFLFCFVFLISISCKKNEESILGSNMHSETDLVGKYNDTVFEIVAFSVKDDSLVVENSANILLGSVSDKYFGTATYNLVTELDFDEKSSVDADAIYTGSRVDSVVLVLPFSGFFPTVDKAMNGKPITFTLYEIIDKLSNGSHSDSLYSVSSEVNYNPAAFAGNKDIVIKPKPFDTIFDSITGARSILPVRAYLSKEFGKKLLSYPADAYLPGSIFSDYFAGIYLKVKDCADPSQSTAISFSSLLTAGASIRVYFNNGTDENVSYIVFALGPTRFTQVKRNRSTSTDPLFLAQMRGDTSSGKERLYVEGSGGSKIQFKVPNFKTLSKNKIILNQVTLVLTNTDAKNTTKADISIPKQLYCFKQKGALESETIPDATNPGGVYNEKTGEYRLLLTRYFQNLIYKDQPAEYLYITPKVTERYGSPCRVRLNGPGTDIKSSTRMKLEVIYTE